MSENTVSLKNEKTRGFCKIDKNYIEGQVVLRCKRYFSNTDNRSSF